MDQQRGDFSMDQWRGDQLPVGLRATRPEALNPTVSRQMSSMPVRDTGVELALRKALHRLGLRFRTQVRSLPGSPDVALTRAKIVVFVDGCFWHRCPQHGTSPKNNGAWWAAKLEANVERDRRKDSELEKLGWLPLHVWEHEDIPQVARRIKDLWKSRIEQAARPSCDKAVL